MYGIMDTHALLEYFLYAHRLFLYFLHLWSPLTNFNFSYLYNFTNLYFKPAAISTIKTVISIYFNKTFRSFQKSDTFNLGKKVIHYFKKLVSIIILF